MSSDFNLNNSSSKLWCCRDEQFERRMEHMGLTDFILPGALISQVDKNDENGYLLSLVDDRIQLAHVNNRLGNPVLVDFSSGTIGFRGRQNVRQELLVKAVLGRNKKTPPSVLDMTGGLGRDSFILACAGCKVTTLERNPVVYLLLSDGLYRAQMDSEISVVVQEIDLRFGDSKQLLETEGKHDVVYLDPMFPERTKSALVKKEMRVFRDVVGEDKDVDLLFENAMEIGRHKVVVKRPRKSSYVMEKRPTYSVEGRSSRFDVYQRS